MTGRPTKSRPTAPTAAPRRPGGRGSEPARPERPRANRPRQEVDRAAESRAARPHPGPDRGLEPRADRPRAAEPRAPHGTGVPADGLPHVTLNRTGARRWEAGHPWIYRGHLAATPANPLPGVVSVVDDRGRFAGRALYSPASQIALRFLTHDDLPIDTAFLIDRLRRARAYREATVGQPDACREVFGESDGLPSLIVDRYGDQLVLQCLSAGLETLRPQLIEALEEVFAPEGILARNDPAVRSLEDLPREVTVWAGEVPDTIDVKEGDVWLRVDPRHGQKTGLFLDQAENHRAAAGYATGRVLDAFTYNGGFALACAPRAEQVVAVDSSAAALALTGANAGLNACTNILTVEANVFDLLKSMDQAKEQFDMVILDPPAFAKNRTEVEGAVRGYKEINLRAMKLLRPGGILISCTCSYHITEELFTDILAAAAADVKRHVRLVERRGQGRDHPLLIGFPESYYLKCFVLQLMD